MIPGLFLKRPPSADTLTLLEHLARVLDSMGLKYEARGGWLMITSKESIDLPIGEVGKDPYLEYRDVLE